ncbi:MULTISPECIES: DUF6380 family protein [unclassified Streptomyces]
MDKVGQGDVTGGKRQATLRCEAASLTATVRRGWFECLGGRAGGSAR